MIIIVVSLATAVIFILLAGVAPTLCTLEDAGEETGRFSVQ